MIVISWLLQTRNDSCTKFDPNSSAEVHSNNYFNPFKQIIPLII